MAGDNLDANGNIPNNYDYPKAGLKKPYSAAGNSATMLALAQEQVTYIVLKPLLKPEKCSITCNQKKAISAFTKKMAASGFRNFLLNPILFPEC